MCDVDIRVTKIVYNKIKFKNTLLHGSQYWCNLAVVGAT